MAFRKQDPHYIVCQACQRSYIKWCLEIQTGEDALPRHALTVILSGTWCPASHLLRVLYLVVRRGKKKAARELIAIVSGTFGFSSFLI